MSGSTIGGIIGATIGFFIGGPAGAMQGFAIGSAIGGVLMPGELPPVQGPRLDDLRAQSSEYGRPIPIVYGTVGIGGNVIEAEDMREVATTTEYGGDSGPSQEVTEYTYFQNFAVVVCEGVADILRIWAGPDKRLIYDGFLLEGGSIRIYRGTEDQLPDPMLEALHGVGNVPAYRGYCYVVFEDFPLANDRNSMPFLTFEVSTAGGGVGSSFTVIEGARLYDPPPLHVSTHNGDIKRGSAQDPTDGLIYTMRTQSDVLYIDKISIDDGLLDSLEVGAGGNGIMALNPLTRKIAAYVSGTSYKLVDLATFTAIDAATPGEFVKADVIYSEGLGDFAWLNYNNEYVDGIAHGDNWGRIGAVFGGSLIDCGTTVAAVSLSQPTTFGGASIGVNRRFEVFDPVARRLISFADACYFDIDSAVLVEVDPAVEVTTPLNVTYNPYIRRIIGQADGGMVTFDPSTFSEDGFPIEVTLFASEMLYSSDPDDVVLKHFSVAPVNLPNMRTHMAFVDRMLGGGTAGDIFLFKVSTTGAGVMLGDVVADLCERAGLSSAQIDVAELTDIVDGYAIAKQTDIRSAIAPLRSAYYFDSVESQGVVKFVKRGGTTVTVIDDDDLCAHAAGSEPGDPLRTTRIQEVELPRSVTVSYLQAATDYSTGTKTARRLTGSSHDLATLEMPLVLSDTKAQEVAEVNLHAAWAQRLQYEFTTSRKYAALEPTDLVQVKGYLMRIMKVTDTPFGIRKFQAVSDESVYTPHVVVTETPPNGGTVYVPGETILAIM